MIGEVTEALPALDREQALHLPARALADDPLAAEVAVRSGEGRRVVGYIDPAPIRASLRTAQDQAALADDRRGGTSLAAILAGSADPED